MRRSRLLHTVVAVFVLSCLVQAVRVLFSALFGLIYDAIFAETMALGTLGVIVFFVVAAFWAPLLAPLRRQRASLFGTALIVALARIPMTINRPAARLWSSIIIVTAAGMYAAISLRRRPQVFATALMLAFAADQFLRAAGNTYDVSLRAWWLPVQATLSLAACALAWLALSHPQTEEAPPAEGGIDVLSGLALGALLFLETSLLGFPNALARWSGADYAVVAPLLMAATLLPVLPSAQWGGFAIFFLTLLIGWVTGQKLYQLGTLAPMLIAQFAFLRASRTLAKPSQPGRPRLSLALGGILFLLLHVVLAFAFTYPYTMPFLRDKGDYVYLFAILFLLLPALGSRSSEPSALGRRLKILSWIAAALVVLLTTAFAWPPRFTPREAGPIRVGTYNVHYGYDSSWRFSLEGQARTIEESGANVVMLQEVDAGRITSYGVDDALWLSRRLRMEPVYAPTLEDLSGLALLTRFPIAEADTQQLTSQLEQTAIVHARLQVGGRPLDAYGTWLGLEPEERARQLDDALAYVGDAGPAVLGGDFNATPDSPTYARIRAAGFEDPFVVGGLDPAPTSPAIEPAERIDFVWARGLDVKDAQVLGSLASDHRMVVVELTLP